jgi:hypothetical protein
VITFTVTGSFARTQSFLKNVSKIDIAGILHASGREGVAALASATPTETSRAASSWNYEVAVVQGVYSIWWTNADIENGFPVVIMLQYGHGTGSGGYVQGRDFINPTIRPVFDKIAERVWKVVTTA